MDLDTMKLKYQAVINLAKAKGVLISNVHIEGEKLLIRGAAPSEAIKNEIWGQAKMIDAQFADLWLDLSIDPSLAPPVRTYTVVKGDSLWKIADKHYGNGSQYPKIIAGNPGQLKDENSVIHPGDVLVIPD